MKKIVALFSAMLFSAAALTACGTADVNDVNDRRVYDVNDYNDRNVYNVNDGDVDGVYDGGANRNIYNRVGDSPFRNDPEVDTDRGLFGPDRDDLIFNDEKLTQGNGNRNMNR